MILLSSCYYHSSIMRFPLCSRVKKKQSLVGKCIFHILQLQSLLWFATLEMPFAAALKMITEYFFINLQEIRVSEYFSMLKSSNRDLNFFWMFALFFLTCLSVHSSACGKAGKHILTMESRSKNNILGFKNSICLGKMTSWESVDCSEECSYSVLYGNPKRT